jgi:hypothetical protein
LSSIVIDGLNEEDFRRSIENRLREGRTGAAVERLRKLIAPYAVPGGLLPERFLTVSADDLVLSGWESLRDAMRRYDQPGRPITAMGIAFAAPADGVPAPGKDGRLKPHLETSWYSDDAWPFSGSTREDLLEGYSSYGCAWSGDCEAVDNTLWLDGVDDLNGALAALEAKLLDSEEPDEDGIRAGSLGACLLSALLVEAVGARIARDGLPRPLCVTAGSNGIYPYFDAPVAGIAEGAEEEASEPAMLAGGAPRTEVPAPRYSSLLMTGIPRARKRPALVLEETDDDLTERLAKLRGLNHAETPDATTAPVSPPATPAGIAPAEGGWSPLATKTPRREAWDFRDMLGPPEPAEAAPPIAGPGFDLLAEPGVPPAPEFATEAAAAPAVGIERPEAIEAPEAAPAVEAPAPAVADDAAEPAPLDPAEDDPGREAAIVAVRAAAAEPAIAALAGPGFPNMRPHLQHRLAALIAAGTRSGQAAPPPPPHSPVLAWTERLLAALRRRFARRK